MRFRIDDQSPDSHSNQQRNNNNNNNNNNNSPLPPSIMSNLFAATHEAGTTSTAHPTTTSSIGMPDDSTTFHVDDDDDDMDNNNDNHIFQEQCVELFQSHQYRSCELVARMELAQAEKHGRSTDFALSMLGACFQATGQYQRAISFYRRLNTYQTTTNEYRYREAVCLHALGSVVEASAVLEAVPESQRTLAMLMLLGNLHLACGRDGCAAACFMQALARNPYCWEALEKLAVQRVDKNRVLGVLLPQQPEQQPQQQQQQQHAPSTQQQQQPTTASVPFPIADMVHAYFAKHRLQTQSALQQFIQLESEYPNNVQLLLKIAALQQQMRDEVAASRTYAKVRQLEDTNVDCMDLYGQVLARQSQLDALNRLAVDMLDVDDKRPEAWTCLAIYHEARRDHEKALAFIDKAIAMDSRHAMSHKIKGLILLADQRPDHAAVSFFRAKELCPDVPSFEGLVDSYLASHKYKEAGMAAKEAISAAPRDPRAVTLVGLALSEAVRNNQQAPENLVQAKRTLHKALAMDPSCLRPLIALVNIYVQEKNYPKAIELLTQGIEGTTESPSRINAPDLLHAKLGNVYILCDRLQDASHAFHIAFSLNPENREAQQGLEKLEKVMRGHDLADDGMADDSHADPEISGTSSTDYQAVRSPY